MNVSLKPSWHLQKKLPNVLTHFLRRGQAAPSAHSSTSEERRTGGEETETKPGPTRPEPNTDPRRSGGPGPAVTLETDRCTAPRPSSPHSRTGSWHGNRSAHLRARHENDSVKESGNVELNRLITINRLVKCQIGLLQKQLIN